MVVSVIAAALGASGLLQLSWLAASVVVVVLAVVEVHAAFSGRLGRSGMPVGSSHTIPWLLAL